MLVFLHLQAAVINALGAAQASHLLVDTQILKGADFDAPGQILTDALANNDHI